MLGDIIIIGGGASGLAAAVSAKLAMPSADVTVCEKLDRVGKKILSTGNGRCNLSNRNISAENYHGSVNAMPVIENSPSAEEFFADMGVLVTADESGRKFLSVFNNEGNHRSSAMGDVLDHKADRTVMVSFKEKVSLELVERSSEDVIIQRISADEYMFFVPAAGFVVIAF